MHREGEGEREGERCKGREGGRAGGREMQREVGREGGREGGREREREHNYSYCNNLVYRCKSVMRSCRTYLDTVKGVCIQEYVLGEHVSLVLSRECRT